jgi:hypothetical protein
MLTECVCMFRIGAETGVLGLFRRRWSDCMHIQTGGLSYPCPWGLILSELVT